MNESTNSLECRFSRNLLKFGFKKSSRVVIGVSGGPDSLALASLYANWAQDVRTNCFAIIIDHGLRTNSAEEAFSAKAELEKLQLNSKVIKINKTPPSGNIQNWARIQRFELLTLEARLFRGVLMLGHHLDDQIETLYLRLAHNSGPIGLLGIKKERLFHSVKIIRPLLEEKKANLRAYCVDKNIRSIEDPSNSVIKFDRVRARTHLLMDKKLSIQLLKLRQHIEKIVYVFRGHCLLWCSKHIKIKLPIFASLPLGKFISLPESMRAYILQQLLWQIGAANYPASNKSIKMGLSKIISSKKFTLGGCIIIVKKERIELHSERKRNIEKKLRVSSNVPTILDNRWLLNANKPIFVRQMSDEYYKHFNQTKHLNHVLKKWPYPARLCVPILVDLDDRVVQPHIEVEKTNINENQKNVCITSETKIKLTPLRKIPFWEE